MTKRRLVLFPWLVSMAFVFLSSPSGLATSLTGDERGEWAIEFSAKPVPPERDPIRPPILPPIRPK
jgi:hypothetical protein